MKSTVLPSLFGMILQALVATTAWSQSNPGVEPSVDGLTESERKILARGEYDRGEIIGGGILGSTLGLGLGHAVQGKYEQTGGIYTAGELGSFVATAAGVGLCAATREHDEGELIPESAECVLIVGISGAVVWSAFRIAELIDVWAHPLVHNQRFRKLKARTERDAPEVSLEVLPRGRDGATVGLAVRF